MPLDVIIDRITRMEKYFDTIKNAVRNGSFKNEGEQAEMLYELIKYYEGGQWLFDYECDEHGELPSDLKRGVLSQDGIYNLLADIEQAE